MFYRCGLIAPECGQLALGGLYRRRLQRLANLCTVVGPSLPCNNIKADDNRRVSAVVFLICICICICIYIYICIYMQKLRSRMFPGVPGRSLVDYIGFF